jgi:hypothetical protein
MKIYAPDEMAKAFKAAGTYLGKAKDEPHRSQP